MRNQGLICVPTVLQQGSHRFFVTLSDCNEPPHIHVEHDNRKAKLWLDPVEIARSGRFKEHELLDIERIVNANRDMFYEEWERYCGGPA